MKPRVALSSDFLKAYSRLPQAQQKKTREFTDKFREDPTQPGINYEKVQGAKDPKLRSVRIDQAYRAIVVKPPAGDVYLCAWVDRHDAAYAWCRDRVFEVNPVVGNLQVYSVDDIAVQAPPTLRPVEGLLEGVSEEVLSLFGIPVPLLPAVRALRTEADLDRLAPVLPTDLSDALYMLASGYTPEQAIDELGRREHAPVEEVNVEDFTAALAHPDSQREFVLVDSQDELEAMLRAPLEQWRVFLHPSQRRLVTWTPRGPARVMGGAGTGKTVVLLHRARHLLREVFPSGRILVTTFTRNLAVDLAEKLKQLCGPDFSRLEVINLHAWALRFLNSKGRHVRLASDARREAIFRQAYEEAAHGQFPLSFCREEWERVVQDQDITEQRGYLLASRAGRGTPLSRRQRAQAWAVFERYRDLLNLEGLVEIDDVIRLARECLESSPELRPYCAVLADEIQDFRTADLRLLRAIVPEGPSDLFMVGDNYQRIYARNTSLSRSGIEVRGRSRRLRINYRTTQRIRDWAVAVVGGVEVSDMEGGADHLDGYRSLRQGVIPTVRQLSTKEDEGVYVLATLQRWLDAGVAPEEICLAARTHAQLTQNYQPLLEENGIRCLVLEGDGELGTDGRVRLATMHRMKGLEFPCILIAGLNRSTLPLRLPTPFSDQAARDDFERCERCLLYVAATRARDELVVTGHGEPSPFITELPWTRPYASSHVSQSPARATAEFQPAASAQPGESTSALDVEIQSFEQPSEGSLSAASAEPPSRAVNAIEGVDLRTLHVGSELSRYLDDHGLLTCGQLEAFLASKPQHTRQGRIDQLCTLLDDIRAHQNEGEFDWVEFHRARGWRIEPTHLAQSLPEILRQLGTGVLQLFEEKERRRVIVERRFGFMGKPRMTLQELGDAFGLSRERVRQIEQKSVTLIRRTFIEGQPAGDLLMHPQLRQWFVRLVEQLRLPGGTLAVPLDAHLATVSASLGGSIEPDEPILALIFHLEELETLSEGERLRPLLIPKLNQAQRRRLLAAFKVIDQTVTEKTCHVIDELQLLSEVNRLVSRLRFNLEEIRQLIDASPVVERVPDGIRGRFEYLRGRGNQAERLLTEHGEPMSREELTRAINRVMVPLGQSELTMVNLGNQMAADDRFAAIGKSGLWGLTSWAGIETRTIPELMREALVTSDRPLTTNEIYEYVANRRPVSANSISIYLQDRKEFTQTDEARWGLSSWTEARETEVWGRKRVAAFVEDFFRGRSTREVDFAELEAALIKASGLSQRSARGKLAQSPAVVSRRQNGWGTTWASYNPEWQSHKPSRRRRKQTLQQRLDEALSEKLASTASIPLRQLVVELADELDTGPATLYSYIAKSEVVETVDGPDGKIVRLICE